jgi:hypothetical protein
LTKSVEWSEDKKQSVAYFIFDGENVISNILGHSDCAASSIATAMICDNDFRDVLCSAYKAYINHMAQKLAPALEPLIKGIVDTSKHAQSSTTDMSSEIPINLFPKNINPDMKS